MLDPTIVPLALTVLAVISVLGAYNWMLSAPEPPYVAVPKFSPPKNEPVLAVMLPLELTVLAVISVLGADN